MTPDQLARLEGIVNEGASLRNRSNRLTVLRSLILELNNPLPGGVVKVVSIRMASDGAQLTFADLSNQSRNTSLDMKTEDGRKLVNQFLQFCDKQIESAAEKMNAIKV